ncbi:MAG: CHASE2 domain-containing protein [Cyanobacteria bacterium P01_B01_bin.77]
MRSVFELKVWHQDKTSCFFLLLWEHGKKKLTASLPYPEEIQKKYRLWRQRYHRFYQLSPPQSVSNSGRLNPGSGDLAHDLMDAEKRLIKAFHRWLGSGELRAIQQQIREELPSGHAISSLKRGMTPPGVDIFLACDAEEIEQLPWEACSLGVDGVIPGALRIVRTAMDEPGGPQAAMVSRKKSRILAVLGDDPTLPLQEDWKALRSLQSIAHVERFFWPSNDSVSLIKQKFAAKICDSRGWDVLFFAGHSDDTDVTGGKIAITPKISLAISEIEDYLTQAKENGLQLAIFNSCSGLSIAKSLVALGLQVVVMREPIRNDVAQRFLPNLCQHLAQHNDIHAALLQTTQHLQSVEKFAYPSAHLIPSFFSPAGTTAYHIQPFGWKGYLQQWLPTKREAFALGTVTLLSLMIPLQDILLDLRTAAQSQYRQLTHQLPKSASPPVTLIAIDQQSLNQAGETIERFEISPLDREYLGQIIDQLAKSNANVVGIDYFLNQEEPKESVLAKSVRHTVETQSTWLIFATRHKDQQWPRDEIANPDWSLEADSYLTIDRVTLPKESTCAQYCPFAYSLALASLVSQQPPHDQLPQPTLQNDTNFKTALSLYLRNLTTEATLQPFLDQAIPPFGLPYIIDFSIPPSQIYHRIPARQFLSESAVVHNLTQQIVIVASDRYTEAKDQFSAPTAFRAWCHSTNASALNSESCSKKITGGELHAYMTHHWLSSHLIVLIPDWWMVLLSALLAKGCVLYLLKQPTVQQKKRCFILLGSYVGYGLGTLQLYISASILIPIFLPSAIFTLYMIPILKQKSTVVRTK